MHCLDQAARDSALARIGVFAIAKSAGEVAVWPPPTAGATVQTTPMQNWSAARLARVGHCIASGDLDVLSELVAGQEVVPDPRAQVALELGHDGLCLQQYLVWT